jgi:hypothetical protein
LCKNEKIASSLIRAGINPEQFFGKSSEKSSQEAKPSNDTQNVVQSVQTDTASVLPKEQSNEQIGAKKPVAEQSEKKQRVTKDSNENHSATEHVVKAQPKPG